MFAFSTETIKELYLDITESSPIVEEVAEEVHTEDKFLAAEDTWYTTSIDKATITSIEIVQGKCGMGNDEAGVVAGWDASEDKDGSITCRIIGSHLYIYTNTADGILANINSAYAFGGFTSVTEITGLEYLDTSYVTDMHWMFGDNHSLQTITIPSSWDTSGVLDMSYMFYNDASLKKINLNNLNMLSCEDISYMFGYCSSLEVLDITEWIYQVVSSMDTATQMLMQAGSDDFSVIVGSEEMAKWVVGNPRNAFVNTMLRDDAKIFISSKTP